MGALEEKVRRRGVAVILLPQCPPDLQIGSQSWFALHDANLEDKFEFLGEVLKITQHCVTRTDEAGDVSIEFPCVVRVKLIKKEECH